MNVILYTTPTCRFCGIAKQFLRQHRVAFVECDLSQDRKKMEELVQRTGRASVPVIEIDGDFVIGFDKNRLAKKLGV
ncbi:glutathione S-transferase N-terminal domain-containing protein [Candidatus Acetothermia bacterium]|jgi:glutaredoxin-like YruB-family protein|nr:glutathione S-transferase N-terminal domain-containing protein [Candidatus Acetothermia bacterium]MCI2431422.1 glutathione S-transferase N-terminal domain-containing protein [Candidatus Acetothermia bacterium]MCI2436189.1 glutathione S-transferase N-terminal domain-containing protein [Candidatus Acetothermia bacterium]